MTEGAGRESLGRRWWAIKKVYAFFEGGGSSDAIS